MGTNAPPWLDPPDEAVFVTINTVNHKDKKAAADLNIFSMKKWLEQWFPQTKDAKPRKDGSILAQAVSRTVADNAIRNAKDFYGECQMVVQEASEMNRSQGVIFSRFILSESTETIVAECSSEGVVDVERIQSWKNGSLSPNGLHVVTFNNRTLPEHLTIGYVRYEVRQYFPRPLRCVKCCTYGHTKTKCSKTAEYCKDCAQIRHENSCDKPKKCCNCEGPHSSWDKTCPILKREQDIIRLKIAQNISFGMARKLYMDRLETTKKSYAEVVMQAADEEAQNMAEEIDAVRKRIEDAKKQKQILDEEIEKLNELARECVKKTKQKKVLQNIINMNTQNNTTEAQPTMSEMADEFFIHPDMDTNCQSQSQQSTTTIDLSVESTPPELNQQISQLESPFGQTTFQMALNQPIITEPMDDTSESAKRPTPDEISSSESDLEAQKRQQILEDQQGTTSKTHNIGKEEYAALNRGQKRTIKQAIRDMKEDSDIPLFYRKGDKIIKTKALTKAQKTAAETFWKWMKYKK
jgi:hypothetical protein